MENGNRKEKEESNDIMFEIHLGQVNGIEAYLGPTDEIYSSYYSRNFFHNNSVLCR